MNSGSSFTLSLPLFFFLYIFLRIKITLEAAPTYQYHVCTNTAFFTPNSTYQNNLNTVLSTLSSASTSATVAASGFSNATSGSASPDKAFGLFLCRGDVSNETCSDCVATATQEIVQRCPIQRVSVIWYDECLLRYSNQSIFSVMAQEPSIIMIDTVKVTDPIPLLVHLAQALSESTNQASRGFLKKVGAARTNFTSLQDLYVLAQCTPDLSSSECATCLRISFGRVYKYLDRQGARVLEPSCQTRFEFYLFYNISALAVVPVSSPTELPPSPPPPMAVPKGKSNNFAIIIIAIVISGTLVVVLFLIAWYLLWKRARKTYLAVQGESGITELSVTESL